MKKILLAMMMAIATSVSALAVNVVVNFTNGGSVEGVLVSQNDTLLVVEPYYTTTHKALEIRPERVKYFSVSGIGRPGHQEGVLPDDQRAALFDLYGAVVEQPASDGKNAAVLYGER